MCYNVFDLFLTTPVVPQEPTSLYKIGFINPGIDWCIPVHRGANQGKERHANVEFKTLFSILKKHLADGDDHDGKRG